ncbi:YlxR family protein [Virgibacillus sp. MSP4-1]|uniref:Glucose-induced regulator RulR n=1 Tax=Salinibacillus aidingensis TaxID=237684 RepID=A0ABN1BEC6_9BACI|nr:YlxR family protein [Virgibacillus sp. MSP4-1]QHS22287.1 YlxR family protein [Virgibacillus sp. MSP4-1]
MAKNKKAPLRKCVMTKDMKPKKELIRVVKNKDGDIFIDETGKKNGRGAYLTKDKHVIEQAKAKDVLSQTFNVKVDTEIYQELLDYVEGVKH